MADVVRRVVTQMGMDSSDYQRGAQAVDQANQKMVASGARVVDSTTKVDAAGSRRLTTMDRLEGRIDKTVRAEQRWQSDLARARRELENGNITQERFIAFQAKGEEQYRRSVAALKGATSAANENSGAVKLQGYQMANLQFQMNDIATGLAMGQSPFTILAQQGTQVTQVFGGVGNTFKYAASFITPMRVAAGALAIVLGAAALRMADVESETRAMSVSLRSFGKDAELTTARVHGLVEAMRDLGVSKGAARGAVSAAIAVPGASGSAIEAALAAAPDFAAAYGGSIDDAAKKLTELGTTGYAAIRKLDEAYNFLSADQAKLIRDLAEHGDKAGAVAAAYQALETRIGGAAMNAMSPMSRATTELARNWQDLIDTIAGSPAMLDMIQSLSSGFAALGNVFTGNLTGAWDSWVKHVTTDPAFAIMQALFNGWVRIGEWTSGIKTPGRGDAAASAAISAWTGIGPETAGATTNDVVTKQLDEQNAAYERQIRVLNTAAGARQILQARLEAEQQAMLKGAGAAQIKAAGDNAAGVATAQLSAAANDNLAALRSQTAGTLALAAAGGVATEAGIRAQAEMQARTAKLQNVTVDVEDLTAALTEQARAAAHLQSVEDLRKARLDTGISQAKAAAAAITDPAAARAAEVAIQRQQKLNDLTIAYKGNVEDVNRAMQEFDKRAAYDDQARYWTDVKAKAAGVSDDIAAYLVDGVTGAGEQGFKGFWDTAWAGAKRFIANLAAEFLKTQFIMPVVMSVVGSSGLSGLLGVAGTAGGATGAPGATGGGFGGLSSLAGLLNGGLYSSSLAGIGSSLSLSGIGQSLGLSNLLPKGGAALSSAGGIVTSAFGNLGYGAIGGLAGALLGLGSGNALLDAGLSTAGSLGGSALGALLGGVGSLGGPIGAVLGGLAGTALGGLFGGKPSNLGANTPIDIAGGVVGATQYDPSKRSQQNIDASQQGAQAFLELAQAVKDLAGATGSARQGILMVGSRDGVQGIVDGKLGNFSTVSAAVDFMVQQVAKSLTGVTNADIKTVLARGGTAEEIVTNLTLVNSIMEATAVAADPLAAALKTVNDSFDDLTARATDLGLSTELLMKLEAKRQEQIAEINATAGLGVYQNVATALGQINDFVTAQQLSGSSSLNPLGRQSLAQQSFDKLLSAVNDNGDLSQVGALTSAASSLLDITRQNYGSTAGFTSVEGRVLQSLADLGLDIGSQQSMGDQITKAIQLSTQTNVEKQNELIAVIETYSRRLELLADRLSERAA